MKLEPLVIDRVRCRYQLDGVTAHERDKSGALPHHS